MRGCKASSPRRQNHERQTDAYQHQRADDDVFVGDRQRPDPGVDVVQRDIQQCYDAAGTEGGGRQGDRRLVARIAAIVEPEALVSAVCWYINQVSAAGWVRVKRLLLVYAP